jgi:hypothetical protein
LWYAGGLAISHRDAAIRGSKLVRGNAVIVMWIGPTNAVYFVDHHARGCHLATVVWEAAARAASIDERAARRRCTSGSENLPERRTFGADSPID